VQQASKKRLVNSGGTKWGGGGGGITVQQKKKLPKVRVEKGKTKKKREKDEALAKKSQVSNERNWTKSAGF